MHRLNMHDTRLIHFPTVPSPETRAESYLAVWILLEALNSLIGHFTALHSMTTQSKHEENHPWPPAVLLSPGCRQIRGSVKITVSQFTHFASCLYFWEAAIEYDSLIMMYLLFNIFKPIPDSRITFYRDVHPTAGGWYANWLWLPHLSKKKRKGIYNMMIAYM